MQAKPISVLLASGVLLAGCSGPGPRATEEWEKACGSDTGTHIARTAKDVDGIIFEGKTRIRAQTPYRNDLKVYRTIPIGALFDMRQKRYGYVEFSVPDEGAYTQLSYDRLNLPRGDYRITLGKFDDPNCAKPQSIGRVAAGRRCFVVTPVPQLTAPYKVIQSKAVSYYDYGVVESIRYIVVDNSNDEVMATHSRHSLGWHEGGFPMAVAGKKFRRKSCPDDGSVFNIRTVLRPADGDRSGAPD